MTPQEAAEQYADNKYGKNLILPVSCEIHEDGLIDFMAGAKWQSEQHNQALSSALKEIAELTRWKNEMLQLWNKLDAYLQTRNDTRLGESKIDFVIKVMKEQESIAKSA